MEGAGEWAVRGVGAAAAAGFYVEAVAWRSQLWGEKRPPRKQRQEDERRLRTDPWWQHCEEYEGEKLRSFQRLQET